MAIQFDVVRPDDLLNLRLRGVNLRLNAADPQAPFLEVEEPQRPAYLIVTFPPQTIAERAYFEAPIVVINQDPTGGVPADTDTNPPNNQPPVNSPPLDAPGYADSARPVVAMLGRPSRLVFKVPPGHTIPFTTEGVLDWSALELSVSPIAAIGREPTSEEIAAAPGIQSPQATETALEMPYRLIISPTAEVAWNHRPAAFTHHGRTEMWHTRMQLRAVDENGEPVIEELTRVNTAPMRAIWSPDYNTSRGLDTTAQDPELQRTAMAPNDRHQIVILTSAFHGFLVKKKISFPLIQMVGFNAIGPAAGNAAEFAKLPSAYLPIGSYEITVPYVPEPIEARQVVLSPLGGWLKSRGHWDPPFVAPPPDLPSPDDIFDDIFDNIGDIVVPGLPRPPRPRARIANPVERIGFHDLILPDFMIKQGSGQLDLSEWVHIATQGRDHYVRIVYEGELWPYRHRAALVKITERKFKEVGGIVGAYMIQRMFIVVREPEKRYNDRRLPYRRVRLTTLVTPDIAEPEIKPGTARSFWVEVMTGTGEVYFPFHGIAEDHNGQESDFAIPMMFVSISDLPDNAATVAKFYNAKDMIVERQANVPGQKITFAPKNKNGDTTNDNTELVTETINFVVDPVEIAPRMLMAAVKIPQVKELLGTDQPTTIRYSPDYLANDFDGANGVFAEIAKLDNGTYNDENPFAGILADTLGATFNSKQAGGIATPNMSISTLTRELGPVAGKAADALIDSFKPSDFFGDGLSFLFGTFDLAKLIPTGPLGQNAPQMKITTVDIPGGKEITACLNWNPPLTDVDLVIAEFKKDYKQASLFEIVGCIVKELKLDGSLLSEPTFDMTGKLTNFQVIILESVTVNFLEFGFESHSGEKMDVTVKLDPDKPLAFGGDLEFVEELRNAIPPDLFGDGPFLDISPTGITAGFSFALPPVAVGVFALKDVSLGAAMTLPFTDGKPVFDFNVSTREKPFLLSVSIFGGGGFFRLQIDTAGFKMIEAAFEFGITCALDLGVASGEVHVMAGIYFSLQRKDPGTDLTAILSGYLRMGGSLEVLGIIKVSVEFNLSFTYDSGTDKAYGRATLTVEVEVLCFSASVELTVERAFGGESGDPKFGEMYDTADKWSRYALAFA